MRIPIYHIDAFTDRVFCGNPAAVCPLESWPDKAVMQQIAAENNLSETAFFVTEKEGGYHIRWFSPTTEVDLCGHATLAAAHVLFNHLGTSQKELVFTAKGGDLRVSQDGDLILLNFPALPPKPCEAPKKLTDALRRKPIETLCAEDYLCVFETPQQVKNMKPDMKLLAELPLRGVCVTAKGEDVDFVSRFFAPKLGVDEDPVTGSAHCMLTPYWSEKLKRKKIHARQVSKRGGELFCADLGDRIQIAGQAITYAEGFIEI